MSTATLTSKRQLTLPKAVCDSMGLKPGDKFSCSASGDKVVLRRKSQRALDLVGILPPPKVRLTVDQIEDAIKDAAAAKHRPRRRGR